jgi:hypothetical protein
MKSMTGSPTYMISYLIFAMKTVTGNWSDLNKVIFGFVCLPIQNFNMGENKDGNDFILFYFIYHTLF